MYNVEKLELVHFCKPWSRDLFVLFQSVHWTDLIASTDKQTSVADSLNISEIERKRRETVWELFKSECVFLIDHLMVLKHVSNVVPVGHRFRLRKILSVKLYIFSYPSVLTYVLGAQKNRHIETVLLSTHSICFG